MAVKDAIVRECYDAGQGAAFRERATSAATSITKSELGHA